MKRRIEKLHWSIDTINELINDWMSFELILEVKRRMKDIESKNYISMFLKTVAPVIVYEVAESLELMGILPKEKFFYPGMKKKVQEEREKFVKKVIVRSSQPKLIEQEMGLNFNEKVYDINILVKDDVLMDMNYEIFNENIEENFEFWDSLFALPQSMINTVISCLGIEKNVDDIYAVLGNKLNEVAENMDQQFSCKRYSYSVYKLFSCNGRLEDIDKILILYRYRLITSIYKLEEAIPNINICLGDIRIFDIRAFFRKYKAVIICIIGSELKNMKTEFAKSIQEDMGQQIGLGAFWSVNRKLRNNIHYQKTEVLTEEEKQILDLYQPIYFAILRKHFNKNIFIDIDKECTTMTGFLKACREKGMNKEDIDKYYYYYFMKYRLIGKV